MQEGFDYYNEHYPAQKWTEVHVCVCVCVCVCAQSYTSVFSSFGEKPSNSLVSMFDE